MAEETHRVCKACTKNKPIAKFHKNGKRGRHYICSTCRNQRRKSWDKSWRKNPTRIFKDYKRSAIRRELEFKMSKEEFAYFKDSSCHYCGSKLDQIRLDRVNNDVGYLKSNVVPCCSLCNFLKNTMGKEQFLEHISKIYLHQKEKQNGE